MGHLDTWFAGVGAGATVAALPYAAYQVHQIARDLGRRAEFEVEIGLEMPKLVRRKNHHGRQVLVVDPGPVPEFETVIRIGLHNTGERRAEHTLLNITGPTYLGKDFYFSWADGSPRKSRNPPTPTGPLNDIQGNELEAWFLYRDLGVITLRHHYVSYARCLIPTERARDGVPFHVIFDSDDLSRRQPEGVDLHFWVRTA